VAQAPEPSVLLLGGWPRLKLKCGFAILAKNDEQKMIGESG